MLRQIPLKLGCTTFTYLLKTLNHFSNAQLSLRLAKTLPDKPLVYGRSFVCESDSRKVLVIPSSKK